MVNVRPFTPELQNKISETRKISFAGITIYTFPNYASEEECNLVVLMTEQKITEEDLREFAPIRDMFDFDPKYAFITGAPYGVEIFNLAPKRLDIRTFIDFAHQFALAWSQKYNIDIDEYHVKNHLFDVGFHFD